MKIADLTEEEIVSIIARKLISKPSIGEHLYYPDDARDVLPRAPRIIVSMDAYTVNSLRLPWRSYVDIAWSAFTGAISDVIAKGGIPHACMVALGLQPNMDIEVLEEIITGLREASQYYKVRILGGDTNKSSEVWIAISVLGFTTSRAPPNRSGLKPGDFIIVTGVYGPMGYVAKHGVEEASREPWVVDNTKRPQVRVELGYIIGNHYKVISASMDVSDGLGYTLESMSRLSGCAILIEKPPIVPKQLMEKCKSDVKCVLEYVLIGGEEYGVAIGVKAHWVNVLEKDLNYFGIPHAVVGRVIGGEPGLYFGEEKIMVKRYDQFKGWSSST